MEVPFTLAVQDIQLLLVKCAITQDHFVSLLLIILLYIYITSEEEQVRFVSNLNSCVLQFEFHGLWLAFPALFEL